MGIEDETATVESTTERRGAVFTPTAAAATISMDDDDDDDDADGDDAMMPRAGGMIEEGTGTGTEIRAIC